MTTGQRMKLRRKELGLSAEYVAGRLNLSPATIYRYENGGIDKVPGDILEPLALVLQTTPAYLMGWEEALLADMAEGIQSGRQAAEDEMRRLFGAEHRTLSTYLCEDKSKASVLYYKAVDRRAAPELSNLITMVEDMDYRELEKIRRLVCAYLNAGKPIREIVDTALKPYDEEEDIDTQIG